MSNHKNSMFSSLTFLVPVLAMLLFPQFLEGYSATGVWAALIAGVVLGVAYLLLRPLLRLVTLPMGCVTFGLFFFVVDALLIMLCGALVPGFYVAGFGWAVLGAILISLLTSLFNAIGK